VKRWLAVALLATSAPAWASAQPQPALVAAAESGDTAAALTLIQGGANVDATASDGTTALEWAVHRDDVPLIDALLKAHANVGVANGYGSTAMAEAAIYGDSVVIEKLLAAGADVESANADGQTALMIVARAGNMRAAQLLLRHGANVNAVETWRGQTALMWAAAQSCPDMVRLLLKHGAHPDARSLVHGDVRQITAEPRIQARPLGGLTSLLYAARQGCLACVEALVEGGATVDLPDPQDVRPLLMAIENFHFDIAKYLLEKGANPNRWDWWGRTPLYGAVDLNTLPYGGWPDRRSLDSTTSLDLIRILLDHGANPNAQLKLFPPYRSLGHDRGGDRMLTIGATPLLRAAKAADVDSIRLLLAHHALVDLPNRFGTTPLLAAAGVGSGNADTRGKFKTEKDAVESIDLLAAAGANVNAKDDEGLTALHGAALWGSNEVVKCLVRHNADLYAKDTRGATPVDSALGIHGGGGPGGNGGEVHKDTAALLQQFMASNGGEARRPL
jgi:uncharacterized protein